LFVSQELISFGYGMEQSMLSSASSDSALVRPHLDQQPIHAWQMLVLESAVEAALAGINTELEAGQNARGIGGLVTLCGAV